MRFRAVKWVSSNGPTNIHWSNCVDDKASESPRYCAPLGVGAAEPEERDNSGYTVTFKSTSQRPWRVVGVQLVQTTS